MILIDLTYTSHSPARTGVQRVAHSLLTSLSTQSEVGPVCFDPYQDAWRFLNKKERQTVDRESMVFNPGRSVRWSLAQKARGYFHRFCGLREQPPEGSHLIVPEIFLRDHSIALARLFPHVTGPRIAVFHDALALRLPYLSSKSVVERFPFYMHDLLQFDGIAGVSEDSSLSLIDYWKWCKVASPPAVTTIPLGIGLSSATETPPVDLPVNHNPAVLCVATIEGRKNHLALLRACKSLWDGGLHFDLNLVGTAHPTTGKSAKKLIGSLSRSGYPIHYFGFVKDAELSRFYQRAYCTVYPSLWEGFGLPVFESLKYAKPCICSASGALGEAAQGGGCLALRSMDSDSIAHAILTLLTDSALYCRLRKELERRTFKTWREYSTELLAWIRTVKRRPDNIFT